MQAPEQEGGAKVRFTKVHKVEKKKVPFTLSERVHTRRDKNDEERNPLLHLII